MTDTLCQRAFNIALQELGVHEVPGPKSEKRILEFHQRTTLKATDDETPWCSAFANFCVQEAGGNGTKDAMARSWLNWGHKVDDPQVGDIVVFSSPSRGPDAGHVAFFVASLPGLVLVLGGNQLDSVCIWPYPKSRLLGYRRSNDVQTKANP